MTEDEARAALLLKVDEPSSVSADGVSVTNRPISEVIAVYDRAVRRRRRTFGDMVQKLIPPGSTSTTVV